MDATKKIFFDNRDKYLSFVHATDEKIKIAFYLSAQLDGVAPGRPYRVLDAGTGEGTVIATFLTALHRKMPNVPIVVTGKEISIDDICILLTYLADRFAEHPSLVFSLTNLSYRELNNMETARFERVEKAIRGDTSHAFGMQLMNMQAFIKKHWELRVAADGTLKPKNKVFFTLYREDQKVMLQHVLAEHAQKATRRFDFIIASQPFRLRRALAKTVGGVLAPLLSLLRDGGRMVLIYSSGRDFSRALLRHFYPRLNPYENAAPARLLAAMRPLLKNVKVRIDSLRYGFINLHLGRAGFSLTNIFSLWNALTYVGQISESESGALELDGGTAERLQKKAARLKNMTFVDNVIRFDKMPRRSAQTGAGLSRRRSRSGCPPPPSKTETVAQ